MFPLLFALSIAAPQDDIPYLDEKVISVPKDVQRNAVLATTRIVFSGSDYRFASGVTIAVQGGYAYVLTASHALGQGGERQVEFFSKKSYPLANGDLKVNSSEIAIVHRLPAADFAILKILLPEKTDPPAVVRLTPALERPKRFPVTCFSVGCSKKGEGPPTPVATTIIGRYLRTIQLEKALFWRTELPHEAGRSGGPLLDKEGRVIGICTANMINPNGGNHGYFTHIDEIEAFMKKNGLLFFETK